MAPVLSASPESRSRKTGRRKIWLIPILLLGFPLLVSWPLWHFAKNRLAEGLDDWVRHQQSLGNQVRFQGPETSGFPFAFDNRLTALDIRHHDGWRWRSPHLQARLDLAEADRVELQLASELLVDLPPEWNAKPLSLSAAGPFRGTALLGDPALEFDVRFSGRELELKSPDIVLTAEEATLRTAGKRQSEGVGGNHFFSLTLREVEPPPLPAIPLEGAIARSEIALRILGDLAGTQRRDVAAWQAGGGEIDLQRLFLLWQDLEIELAKPATLRLDSKLQPSGELEFRARGLDALLNRLEKAGRVPSDRALGLRFLLLAMTRVEAGQAPYVLLPVSLRQGQVFLGPQLVARIPPLP